MYLGANDGDARHSPCEEPGYLAVPTLFGDQPADFVATRRDDLMNGNETRS